MMTDIPSLLWKRLVAPRNWRSDGWHTAFFSLYLGLAVVSAFTVFLLSRSLTQEVEHNRFVASAEQAASRLAHDIDLKLANLRALKGLFNGSVHVSRDEFSAFVQALKPREAVQSLQWIPRVFALSRDEYEAAAREDGLQNFRFRQYDSEGTVVEAADRLEYFPVYYTEPRNRSEEALGLDLSSSPVSRDALLRARDSGDVTASRRVRIISQSEERFGILVFEPIYADTALDLDARIERLEGFARGVFNIADLIELAIPAAQFQVEVIDVSAGPGEQQLYLSEGFADDDLQHAVSLQVADREWSVRMAPAAASALSTLPWFAAAAWLVVLLILWTLRELVSSRRHSHQLAVVNHRLEALSEERQRAIQELERSNRELDDFAYIASHDLKEPLRALYNHANFLMDDYHELLDEAGQKRLKRLVALSRRMEKLTADLLYFSRLGRGELAMETVDLNEVIVDIEVNLSEALQRQNAEIVIPKPLPDIQGHRPHITALFQNLISNGIKYNESERKVIEIGAMSSAIDDRSEGFETFYVRDNGIGVDEDFKDEVFRIFRRLNSEKAYGEGTGAGLSFVKKIIENQGGSIWLTSAGEQGTTFFFTLTKSNRTPLAEQLQQAA